MQTTRHTKKLAEQIAPTLTPNTVVALFGDLGSGKTTFTSYLVGALGIKAIVQSPTFVLVRRYAGDGINGIKIVNHVDLYRIANVSELADLGLPELFTEPHAITVVEWPELCEPILPKNAVRITFEYVSENERAINVQNLS